MDRSQSKRVVVAMSGGVDSSVAALLLKKQGHEVIGIALKLWDYGEEKGKTCCSLSDVADASKVCDRLGVPFYVFNHKKDFERGVILPFVAEYRRGRTPNPCILCNHHVKFDPLLGEASKLGADYLATGHYARIRRGPDGASCLLKGRDAKKDQSYVLYHLGQDRLRKILFPVGDYTKDEVRKMARENGLPNADKPDSQDICFIPNNDHAKFVENNSPHPPRTPPLPCPSPSRGEGKREGVITGGEERGSYLGPGNFVDKAGNVLGRHRGIHHYTVGQRRGLKIGFGERMYVTRIDPEKNEVELGLREETFREGLVARDVHWVHSSFPNGGSFECGVKTRYQKDEFPAVVEPLDDPSPGPPIPHGGPPSPTRGEGSKVIVRFRQKTPFVSPGQAAVFYRGDEVIGGGWIERAL